MNWDWTIKQLAIAAGLARHLTRTRIMRDVKISAAYITKLNKTEEFQDLVKFFKILPVDEDTKEYKGRSTLLMDVGKFIYNNAEKDNLDN